MLFDEIGSYSDPYTSKLEDSQLDDLLGPSSLFPSRHSEPENLKAKEVEKLLQEKCTLYKLDEDQTNKHNVPPLVPRKKRKRDEDDTAGPNWFNMKRPELTPEIIHDVNAMRLRSHLNPKKFYKKKDMEEMPKYFQIGTYLPSPFEPKSHSLEKSSRRKPLVEQLLEEDAQLNFSRKKWQEVREASKKLNKKQRGAKKMSKKKLGFK
jgi:hypothetical protein